MKFFKSILTFCLIVTCACNQQLYPDTARANIEFEDLKLLVGEWEGSLTYLNYSDGTPFTMPANLIVEEGSDNTSLILNNIYPNEPSANSSGKLNVSDNRSQINNEQIISRTKLSTGEIEIKTEFKGKDDSKRALIQHIYRISQDRFSNTKKVKFANSTEWIKRNEFSYNRKK